ncbi:Trp operon leader peptide [Vibrio sp. WXL103]
MLQEFNQKQSSNSAITQGNCVSVVCSWWRSWTLNEWA